MGGRLAAVAVARAALGEGPCPSRAPRLSPCRSSTCLSRPSSSSSPRRSWKRLHTRQSQVGLGPRPSCGAAPAVPAPSGPRCPRCRAAGDACGQLARRRGLSPALPAEAAGLRGRQGQQAAEQQPVREGWGRQGWVAACCLRPCGSGRQLASLVPAPQFWSSSSSFPWG